MVQSNGPKITVTTKVVSINLPAFQLEIGLSSTTSVGVSLKDTTPITQLTMDTSLLVEPVLKDAHSSVDHYHGSTPLAFSIQESSGDPLQSPPTLMVRESGIDRITSKVEMQS